MLCWFSDAIHTGWSFSKFTSGFICLFDIIVSTLRWPTHRKYALQPHRMTLWALNSTSPTLITTSHSLSSRLSSFKAADVICLIAFSISPLWGHNVMEASPWKLIFGALVNMLTVCRDNFTCVVFQWEWIKDSELWDQDLSPECWLLHHRGWWNCDIMTSQTIMELWHASR